MINQRREESSNLQIPSTHPIYLDSAYKQLLRQELKASALHNRTKVLNINQQHILKQVQNNHSTLQKLNHVKNIHFQDIKMLSKDKQKKAKILEEQKVVNEQKRKRHQKQMSTIAIAKVQQRDKIRQQAKKNRKENQRLILESRQQEHLQKREIRNKIHEDIIQSRSTIQNFFINKHDKIVTNTQQQIKKLNQKRIKQQLRALSNSGKIVDQMQNQMKEMKITLKDSRVGLQLTRQQSSLNLKKKEGQQIHPMVRKIDAIMSTYNKSL